MLFDLHTHCKINESDGIVNCSFDDDFSLFLRFSLGIHPWDVDEHWEEKYAMLVGLLKNPPVGSFHDRLCAIGEIGMDKLRGGDMKIQEICFSDHDQYFLVLTVNGRVDCYEVNASDPAVSLLNCFDVPSDDYVDFIRAIEDTENHQLVLLAGLLKELLVKTETVAVSQQFQHLV